MKSCGERYFFGVRGIPPQPISAFEPLPESHVVAGVVHRNS
jgi:hypothetical protein